MSQVTAPSVFVPLARALLLAGTVLAAGLDLAALARYASPSETYRLGALFGVFLLALVGVWLWHWAFRSCAEPLAYARRSGITWGTVAGLLWVLEIGFNNFISARSGLADLGEMARSRDLVDNTFWGLVALCLLWGSVQAARARHSGRWRDGLFAGAWGGLVSGLCACVMGLLLVTAWMPFLVNDPLNAVEFAHLNAGAAAHGPAAYVAYQTLAGAFLHLTVLGVAMGALLGALGGTVGPLTARWHPTMLKG